MSEEAKVKALFPEGVEKLTISKNDYDRLYGDMTLENIELKEEIERLNNIIKDIKNQLDYLETYSSKEDVFEDMKRRLDRIESIIGSDK